MTNSIKKTLLVLSVIPFITGCKVNTYELNHFFDKGILENREVNNLPKTPGNLLYYRYLFGHTVYSNGAGTEAYTAYIQDVYSYLKSQNYSYLGGLKYKDGLLNYTYKVASDLEGHKSGNTYYFFYSHSVTFRQNEDGTSTRELDKYHVLALSIEDYLVRYSEDENASEEDKLEFQSNFTIRFRSSFNVTIPE